MKVIRAIGHADGTHCPHAGEYLKSFDFEASDGRGFGEFTKQRKEAQRFANAGEIFRFWRTVPKCRPSRPDGKPNRPLTALHIEILDADAELVSDD